MSPWSPRVKIRPKWDWNYSTLTSKPGRSLLKSDQNGIEIFDSVAELHLPWVKIRPKWDWNTGININNQHNQPVKIRPKWDWNGNFGISIYSEVWVKIRPKWDWNDIIHHPLNILRGELKSDQNGIEITIFTTILFEGHLVKIRPKWDWNLIVAVMRHLVAGLKSDQNGIEIYPIYYY